MIRYAITGIKKDGLRHLSCDNNDRNNFVTEKEAQDKLSAILNNEFNSPEHIALLGSDLRIDPIECYETGDAKGTIISTL